jgi:hypothetical protein
MLDSSSSEAIGPAERCTELVIFEFFPDGTYPLFGD